MYGHEHLTSSTFHEARIELIFPFRKFLTCGQRTVSSTVSVYVGMLHFKLKIQKQR